MGPSQGLSDCCTLFHLGWGINQRFFNVDVKLFEIQPTSQTDFLDRSLTASSWR